jgi:tetratricopeptide (TPR) repeat protein
VICFGSSMLAGFVIALAFQPDAAMLRRIFEEGLAQHRQRYGASDVRTAQSARDLGLFLARQGEAEAARAALSEAVRIDSEAIGASAPQTLADVGELAAVSEPAAAAPLWQRASEAAEPALAARALAALGDLHNAAGDRTGAAGFYRGALANQEIASGRDAEAVALRLSALALAVEPRDGIPLLERAVTIDRARLGRRHPQTATMEANLAGLLVHAGRHEQAILAAGDALSIFQETLGEDHPRCAVTASILAFALESKGDRIRAGRMYRLAIAIDERAYGPGHPQTAADMRALAEFLRIGGQAREAAEWERKAAAIH